MANSYPKGSTGTLGRYFNVTDFDCQCGRPECNVTIVDALLVTRLDALTDIIGHKPTITSGFRCHAHQMDLTSAGLQTAKGISTHEEGMAADLKSPALSGLQMETYARKAGFTSVGVASTWIHADIRTGNRRWLYT